METKDPLKNLKRSFQVFVASVGLLYVVVSILFFLGYFSNRQRAEEGREAHAYACAQREYQEESIRGSNKFIADVVSGRRALPLGLTLADLKAARDRTQSALDSTSFIDC